MIALKNSTSILDSVIKLLIDTDPSIKRLEINVEWVGGRKQSEVVRPYDNEKVNDVTWDCEWWLNKKSTGNPERW